MDQPNLQLAKKLNTAAWIVSAVVLALVALMRRIHIELPEGVSLSFLPPFHATVNAITAVVLVVAYYFIRKKQVEAHKKTIYLAIGLSVIFLLSYVAYHITTPPTTYQGEWGIIYYPLLITHIVLAAVIFPFILFTFVRAYTNQFERHRRMAKWVWPIWLYVAVTGPVCYLMLMPYYQ
jgi:putative membrane protein